MSLTRCTCDDATNAHKAAKCERCQLERMSRRAFEDLFEVSTAFFGEIPDDVRAPIITLVHAMLARREVPENQRTSITAHTMCTEQRAAWAHRIIFERRRDPIETPLTDAAWHAALALHALSNPPKG